MTDTLIAYVDGFNLYHGLHERWGRRYLWLDLVALVESLRPKQRLSKIKYYTAGVLDDPAAQARQDNYLNALVASGGRALEIVHGRYQRKTISCRRCGASWTTYEEHGGVSPTPHVVRASEAHARVVRHRTWANQGGSTARRRRGPGNSAQLLPAAKWS